MITTNNACNYLIRVLIPLIGLGCNGTGSKKENTDGIEINIIEKGIGRKVEAGDYLQLLLTYQGPDEKTIFDSRELGEEFVLEAGRSLYKGSLEEGFLMLHEGDSAAFTVSADSVYKHTFSEALPAGMKPGDKLRIVLRLQKVYDPAEYNAKNERNRSLQIETESRAVEIYLLNNGLPVQAVKPGVYFFELKKGSGPKPIAGDSVFIRYTGRFLNGEIFDGSNQSGLDLLAYRLGNGERLVEWERAVSTMHMGSVARLILCSPFAYGPTGSGVVPSNTPIVYDLELVRTVPSSAI